MPLPVLAVYVGMLGILYVMVGYPLLLGLLAWRVRPRRREPSCLAVSILIPVQNGQTYLRAKLNSILACDYPRELLEIIVISDGSTDGTDEIAREFAPLGVQLLRVRRGGKPAALNAAIPRAKGEILVLTDVRQELAEDCLRHLIVAFADPTVGAVSGEVIMRKARNQEQSEIGLYWRYETWIRSRLSRVDSIFGATGPIYAIRRTLTVQIPEEVLLDDMYMPLAGFFKGYRLVVEPAARVYDTPGSRAVEFQRKVRTLAGNYQLLRYYPQLISPANRMLFHYLSYKIGRLLLPYFLVAVGVGSLGLPEPWKALALLSQAGFYGFSLLDEWIRPGALLKKISSPCHTFMTMMFAVLCGLRVFFVDPRSMWKVTGGAGAPAPLEQCDE